MNGECRDELNRKVCDQWVRSGDVPGICPVVLISYI